MSPYFVLTKPAGPACNLRCDYCFYLEKKSYFDRSTLMRDDVLETFVRDYIASQDTPEIHFGWQGGEPTLRKVAFFRKVVELQQRHANGRKISNAFQTNGTLIDDEWGEFLAANGFLVGISIDGPADLHDAYRKNAEGAGTLDSVLAGLEMLKKHGVEFNTLTTVNRLNAKQPGRVYRFLKEIGSTYMQFIPVVERVTKSNGGLALSGPPAPGQDRGASLSPWSVGSLAYGEFLAAVFREWIKRDVGTIFVQMFEDALASWAGYGSTLCVFAPTCGRQPALEHDGSVYSCDHYVYPEFRLGNLREQPLAALVDSPAQQRFGCAKRDSLPTKCRNCEFLRACNGGCPKHRFLQAADGEPGLNYLCAGYRHFFTAAAPKLRAMAQLLQQGRPAAEVMGTTAASV